MKETNISKRLDVRMAAIPEDAKKEDGAKKCTLFCWKFLENF